MKRSFPLSDADAGFMKNKNHFTLTKGIPFRRIIKSTEYERLMAVAVVLQLVHGIGELL